MLAASVLRAVYAKFYKSPANRIAPMPTKVMALYLITSI